ncbi:putative ABC transport system substrate-binding protein [Peptoclostridium litorale DSM 5388]|uniref:Putative ABC transporter, substrate-binding protein n=1 Tax=Peptoclostridium litorale DSM 5388 TaxID=1121324 RepID=A0A069RCQ1_PEPLI|nr:ABC transporter substrate-binding protein [Peptoclostridium litorale]KDR94538.1 putative ABC transporter, substrate-binding protein [Peptoclostridium litorale DSM 5388]SIO37125.1 putative ABC transport system substrate-binding protein [Peptoclostridium litorale DSM 5388]
MKMNKMLKKIAVVAVSAALLTGCGATGEKAQEKIEVGISQIVEYSALDENREGFVKALEDAGYVDGENIEIDIQNAQGDIATAQTIAQSFASQKKDMIFAIATPSAQGAYNATKEIPIMISSVTDPVAAGLVNSMENPGTNVSGTSDYIPVSKQIELIKTFAPDAKRIGVLYNTSEVNSQVQLDQLKEEAKGYEIVEVGVTSTNEVNQAISSMLGKIDVLYAPTDQLVVSAMPIIVEKTMAKKIPVIAAEKGSVELGALATQGINYYKLGYETGKMAVKVLKGEEISSMPVRTASETDIIVNEDTLKALGLEKPQIENVVYVNGE